MNDNTTYFTDLITRYFSGEITEDELSLLSQWLKADQEHEEIFKQYRQTWNLLEKQKIHSKINADREWAAILTKMDVNPTKNGAPAKVVPLNQNRNTTIFSFQNTWKVAAAITVLLVFSFLLYYYMSKPTNIFVTAQATNIEQLLPDGSVVTLHAGSQISYPEKFEFNTRNVQLKGEAYFKVAHDKTKPFIVESGDARIEVLGTEFNVNTNASSGSMEVVLTAGKISVYYKAKPQNTVLLMPGEKAELITAQNQIRKSANSDPNYMSWKTRLLVFNNETMEQVINTLQSVYETPVVLTDSQLATCRVTASFNDQSLESVLAVITQTLDLKVKQKGEIIELSGTGCR